MGIFETFSIYTNYEYVCYNHCCLRWLFYGLFEKRIYDLCNHTHESYNEKDVVEKAFSITFYFATRFSYTLFSCIIQKYTKLFTFFRWVWKRVNFIFTLFSSSSCVSYINSVSVKEKTWLVL